MPDIDDMTLELILRREANKGTGASVQLRAMFLTDPSLWTPTGRISDTPTIAEFMEHRTMLNERPAQIGLVDAGYGPSGVPVWRNTNTMKMTGVMRGYSAWLAIAMKAADNTFRVLWAGPCQSIMFDAWAETKIPSGALELVLSEDSATPAVPLGDAILTDAEPAIPVIPPEGGVTDKSIIEAIDAAKAAISKSAGGITTLGGPLGALSSWKPDPSYVPPPDFEINWAEHDRRDGPAALGDLRSYEHLEPGSLRFMVSSGTEWLHVEDVSALNLRADDAPKLRNQITMRAKAVLKDAYNAGRIKTPVEEKPRDTRVINVVRTSGHTGTDAMYGFGLSAFNTERNQTRLDYGF